MSDSLLKDFNISESDKIKFISNKISFINDDNKIYLSFIDTKISDNLFIRCRGGMYSIYKNNII